MAGKPITYYGVTTDLLAQRYFPTGFADPVQITFAQACIDDVANAVEMRVRAARLEPDSITEGHSPLAYRFLQTLVLKGSALAFHSRFNPGADLTGMRDEYAADIRLLEQRQEICLSDVPAGQAMQWGGAKFNPR